MEIIQVETYYMLTGTSQYHSLEETDRKIGVIVSVVYHDMYRRHVSPGTRYEFNSSTITDEIKNGEMGDM
jgi:hypothetical protein